MVGESLIEYGRLWPKLIRYSFREFKARYKAVANDLGHGLLHRCMQRQDNSQLQVLSSGLVMK